MQFIEVTAPINISIIEGQRGRSNTAQIHNRRNKVIILAVPTVVACCVIVARCGIRIVFMTCTKTDIPV